MSFTTQRSVLLFAHHFPPEPLPGAARPSRFFQYLPEFGYQPEVITAAVQPEPNPHIHVVPATTYLPNKYTLAGAAEILLHKLALPTELALLWAGPAAARARRLMKDKPVSAVISTIPPLTAHLAALLLKIRYGLPWIADFRDPLYDNPYCANWPRRFRAANLAAEKLIFHYADVIVAVSDVVAGWWRKRYPRHAHKIQVLWNGYNPAENLACMPIPPRPHRVLTHVGNLYGKRRSDIIVNALEILFSRNALCRENVRLQFVGEIADTVGPALIRLERDGVMECTGLIPRADALQKMKEADYLMLLDIQDGEGYTVPSKLYEYVRIGRPILTVTQPGSPVERIVTGSGIPNVVVYPKDPQDTVCRKLQQLFELGTDYVKPSEWFLNTFDGHRQTATLAAIIRSVEAERSSATIPSEESARSEA